MHDSLSIPADDVPVTKSEERRAFVFLAVFLVPILSFVLVGSYGFAIWMSHLLLGPPAY